MDQQSATPRICSICKKDLTGQKRTKDTRGNYYCAPCWEKIAQSRRVAAPPQPPTSPSTSPPSSAPPPSPPAAAPLSPGNFLPHHHARAARISFLLGIMCFAAAVLVPAGWIIGIILLGMVPNIAFLIVVGLFYAILGTVYTLLSRSIAAGGKISVVIGFVLGILAALANAGLALFTIVTVFLGNGSASAFAATVVSSILAILFSTMAWHCGCTLFSRNADQRPETDEASLGELAAHAGARPRVTLINIAILLVLGNLFYLAAAGWCLANTLAPAAAPPAVFTTPPALPQEYDSDWYDPAHGFPADQRNLLLQFCNSKWNLQPWERSALDDLLRSYGKTLIFGNQTISPATLPQILPPPYPPRNETQLSIHFSFGNVLLQTEHMATGPRHRLYVDRLGNLAGFYEIIMHRAFGGASFDLDAGKWAPSAADHAVQQLQSQWHSLQPAQSQAVWNIVSSLQTKVPVPGDPEWPDVGVAPFKKMSSNSPLFDTVSLLIAGQSYRITPDGRVYDPALQTKVEQEQRDANDQAAEYAQNPPRQLNLSPIAPLILIADGLLSLLLAILLIPIALHITNSANAIARFTRYRKNKTTAAVASLLFIVGALVFFYKNQTIPHPLWVPALLAASFLPTALIIATLYMINPTPSDE